MAERSGERETMISKALSALPLLTFALAAAAPAPAPPVPSFIAPTEIAANPANHLFLELSNGGKVEIVLRPDLAPHHIERMQTLVRQHFCDGLTCHRLVPGFMAQGYDLK